MKKLLPFLALAVVMAAGSCKKIQDKVATATALDFTHGYNEEIALPSEIGAGDTVQPLGFQLPFDIAPPAFATNVGQILKDNNTSAEKLTSVKLSQLSLAITQPANSNLDFLDGIQVYMSTSGADGIKETLVGEKSPMPRGVSSIDLDLKDIEMRQFFLKDSINVRIRSVFNAIPKKATKLSFGTRFRIRAEPLR